MATLIGPSARSATPLTRCRPEHPRSPFTQPARPLQGRHPRQGGLASVRERRCAFDGASPADPTVNKQLNDKERVAAALENTHLLNQVNLCLATADRREAADEA